MGRGMSLQHTQPSKFGPREFIASMPNNCINKMLGDTLKEQRAASLLEQMAREFRFEISCDCNSLHHACPFCIFDHSSQQKKH